MKSRPAFTKIFALSYAAALMLFTIFVLLETFVIPRRYQTEAPLSMPAPTQQATLTENSYTDENISIRLTQHRVHDTEIYVAEVMLSSPEKLKTAFAEQTFGKNLTAPVSEIAGSCGAILAINGDYYSARSSYVLRNGTLYRASAARGGQEDLLINQSGDFSVFNERDIAAETLLSQGAQQILSFGPALVTDGDIAVTKDDEVGKAMVSNPRTAIAQLGPLHYLFVVSDGRTDESEGLTLYELAEFLVSLGAQTAYNLDGGGSATMVFDGRVINNPTTNGRVIRERSVSDIVCIIP